jgi:hypothetical protein
MASHPGAVGVPPTAVAEARREGARTCANVTACVSIRKSPDLRSDLDDQCILKAMPRIDDGSTDGPPGRTIKSAWIALTRSEARELLEALTFWAEEVSDGVEDPGWHTHIADQDGHELTIAIDAGAQSEAP